MVKFNGRNWEKERTRAREKEKKGEKEYYVNAFFILIFMLNPLIPDVLIRLSRFCKIDLSTNDELCKVMHHLIA